MIVWNKERRRFKKIKLMKMDENPVTKVYAWIIKVFLFMLFPTDLMIQFIHSILATDQPVSW